MPTAIDRNYLALLRGVNVGGKNKVPMKVLRERLSGLGFKNVKTYIQSGNIVFNTSAVSPEAEIAGCIESCIKSEFGVVSPVVLRSKQELQQVVDDNPYLKAGLDPATLHVLFLKHLPNADRLTLLDANRSPGDSYVVRDREIFLHLPNNVADTKLTNAYFDSKLVTIATGRNWRTINMLLEIMD